MLRRILSHPLFYIVLLGGCAALFLGVRSAKGGSWLGVRTSQKQIKGSVYQQKSFVDNSVIGVTMLHLELERAGGSSSITFAQAVSVLQKSEAILSNNVVTYLQNASNKQLALITYTKNIDRVVAEADQSVLSLQMDHDNAAQEYSQCTADKSAADNQFYQGLRVVDGGMMEEGYAAAKTSGTCQVTSRVTANTYQAVINKVSSYSAALKQIDTLLTSNEDTIVAHVDLFKDSYLEKLVQIRDQLNVATAHSSLD